MAGAGVSHPPIPLASQIIEECRRQCEGVIAPNGLDSLQEYSWWLQHSFHSPADRQSYFRRLIGQEAVSHANLRLAHLLSSKTVTNLVLTSNFDDYISRALHLFGEHHLVCDHPETIQRMDPENDDLQIVHLHGSCWFYDICNLEGEVALRSERPANEASPMADFVDRVLSARSPLVLGYSGWSRDVFMTALKRRLRRGLRFNVYWFCYRRAAIEFLPKEISEHPDVFFVVPDERPPLPASLPPSASSNSAHLRDGAVMSATTVLDTLIRLFQLPAPGLTANPLAFFASYLKRCLPPTDITDTVGRDLYRIGAVVRRIERAQRGLPEIEQKMELLRDAVRRSQFEQVVSIGMEIPAKDLETDEKIEVVETLSLATARIPHDAQLKTSIYLAVIALGNELLHNHIGSPVEECVATALVNLGNESLDNPAEALKNYEEVIRRFGTSEVATVLFQVARAKYNQAYTYEQLKDYDRCLSLYDKCAIEFHEADNVIVRNWAAWARYNHALILGLLKNQAAERAELEALVNEVGVESIPDIQEVIIDSLCRLADDATLGAKRGAAANRQPETVLDLSRAQTFIQRALKIAPENRYVLCTLGYVQFLSFQVPEAEDSIKRAFEVDDQELLDSLLVVVGQHHIPQDDEFLTLIDGIRQTARGLSAHGVALSTPQESGNDIEPLNLN